MPWHWCQHGRRHTLQRIPAMLLLNSLLHNPAALHAGAAGPRGRPPGAHPGEHEELGAGRWLNFAPLDGMLGCKTPFILLCRERLPLGWVWSCMGFLLFPTHCFALPL